MNAWGGEGVDMVRRDENKRGAGGDLVKNGVVKHSTHIVSRLFTLRVYHPPKREYSRLLSILSAACQTPFFNFRLSLISRGKNATRYCNVGTRVMGLSFRAISAA